MIARSYCDETLPNSRRQTVSYRTNNENSRSNSLLTFKCELFIQMTEQSYSSLFTLTIGFIPMSIKRLLCDFHPLKRVKAKWNGDFRFGGKSAAAVQKARSFKKPFVFFCVVYFPGYFRHFF